MRYVIRYDGGEVIRERPKRMGLWVAVLVILLAAAVRMAWPAVAEPLREALFSESGAAFSEMVEDLREGVGFSEAVTAFCQEVMAGAGFP